jgi:hypothetical protein
MGGEQHSEKGGGGVDEARRLGSGRAHLHNKNELNLLYSL